MKTQPIHIKDMLKDPSSGIIWEVIETRPGGHVELFDKTRTRFWGTYHRVVKGWERVAAVTEDAPNPNRWHIMARHKWVHGAVISESCNEGGTRKRFTATIRGWRGFKLWEGGFGEAQGMVEKVCAKVRELVERVESDDDTVFHEKVTL